MDNSVYLKKLGIMEKIMRKIFPLVLFAAVGSFAHADMKDYFPEAKLQTSDVSRLNVGAGITMKLAHVNAEWVNPYGIAYAKVGAFINDDHEVGGQVGFRYPVILTGTDKNGYYLGAYAGSLKSKRFDDSDHVQYGGGVDLSYVLLNKERISTFSVGIGAGSELSDRDGSVIEETRPQIQFAYTLSVGF